MQLVLMKSTVELSGRWCFSLPGSLGSQVMVGDLLARPISNVLKEL